MELAEFIKTHIEEINNNNFTEVYKDALDSLSYKGYENTVGKLTEIFLDAGIKPLEYMQAVPDNYLANSAITSVEIPDNVKSISNDAFFNCKGLTSITIPDSMTSIGQDAFYNCTGLTSVTMGNGVKLIDGYAFSYCRGLTSITIPNSVTSIREGAFLGCSSLTSITIPDSVTRIDNYVFTGCIGLTSITFNGTTTQWNAISKGNEWNYNTGNYTIHCIDGELKE